jgi:D-glycero-alpha-D-manno-heptose-7-phosphate kinase
VLIARAPLRISFAGGGTDLEAYYARHGGVVVSATINKYFYVFLSRTSDDAVQITSSDFRIFERREAGEGLRPDGDLGYLKAILQQFG